MIHIKREYGLPPVITLTIANAHLLRLAYVSKMCFWDCQWQERISFFERMIDPPEWARAG